MLWYIKSCLSGRRHGGVAQLARACGSYPQCHRFESSRRYHRPVRHWGRLAGPPSAKIRPVGQVVKTRPFHGCNMGSNPVRVTTVGGLAQLVRAPASHAGGHWFESSSLHQKVPDFVRNQELFLLMGLYNCVLHLLFLRDPNADPKAESSGERRIVLSTPLPLFFVFTWPGRSDPPSGRLCACGCRLSDRCFFGMVSVLSLVVNTQAI